MILMENLKNSELQDNNRNSPGEKSGDKQNQRAVDSAHVANQSWKDKGKGQHRNYIPKKKKENVLPFM